jgi:2-oxoglutarate dehydrogenase C-terminal
VTEPSPPVERGVRNDTAIVRIEQLYPLPIDELAAVLDRYPGARDVRWVQERRNRRTRARGPLSVRRRSANVAKHKADLVILIDGADAGRSVTAVREEANERLLAGLQVPHLYRSSG